MNKLFHILLSKAVRKGTLFVTDGGGEAHEFGDGTGPPHAIVLHDKGVEMAVVRNPELGFPETYMDGRWSIVQGTLASLLAVFFVNTRESSPWEWQRALRKLMRKLRQRNTGDRARANAQHHYDVGNDIYALFLDQDWQYSCGYFAVPHGSLEDAQLAKKRHIAAKLKLEPGLRVLDIGCGWGGMALYLSKHAGVDVTGITLAQNQVARASERAAGNPDVRFRVEDYRATRETFDRIVSVGMFEHVGVPHYDEFFEKVANLLTDDGVMLLHSICRTGEPGATNPFIDKYIFPGGYTPALSEVLPSIERAGLIVTDVEVWRLHYAETLRCWAERFQANRDRAVELMDERFARMWEFYLAGCEAGFRVGDVVVGQFQIAKSLDSLPVTRDYMTTAERGLAARDGQRRAPALVANRG